MFDPLNLTSLDSWTEADFAGLPTAEDDRHEYKSSRSSLRDVKEELGVAASAFWNTGGGLFVAGVNASGQPDGGIDGAAGRTPLRDWTDQVLVNVSPRGAYRVVVMPGPLATVNIAEGKAVLVVGFGESHLGAHMAPDGKYYIRAGAHSVPAPHFIVEALFARRGLAQPVVRATFRPKPGNRKVIQLGVIAATDVPALDLEINIVPLPKYLERLGADRFPLQVGAVTVGSPFFFDFHLPTFGDVLPGGAELHLRFADAAGRRYDETIRLDPERQVGPVLLGGGDAELVAKELEEVKRAIQELTKVASKNQDSLTRIANKFR